MVQTHLGAPVYDIDFYSDDVIRDTLPHYRAMLELGPVVWLPQHQNYGFVGYDVVVAALRANDVFLSGLGVAADAKGAELTKGNALASDGELHDRMRRAVTKPLLPGALEEVRPLIETIADGLIENLLAMGDFDAMKDLAPHLPLTIVRDLVGLPDFGKQNMLRWAAAVFDVLGVQNERGREGMAIFQEQRAFIAEHGSRDKLKEGSWTHRIWQMADAGELPVDLARMCVRDYVNPSLDTTISATGELIWQLARSPDQLEILRQRPELIPNATNEAVRLGAPARSFARVTAREVEVAGLSIEKGARVMIVYGAANRDPAAFPDPDRFDVSRPPNRHVGFGSGGHMCAGMHLARLEMNSILKALLPRVATIEVGDGEIALNNTIHAWASLPCRFTPLEPTDAPVAAAAPDAVAQKQDSLPASDRFEVEIMSVEEVGQDIVALVLRDPAGSLLPPWEPGAHVDVHLGDGLIRQYSLTGPMRRDHYRIAVQKDPQSRGGSAAVHALQVGERIVLGMPRNLFRLIEDGAKVLLFSGGIGITPILAKAWRLHALAQPFEWHISARDYARLPFSAELDALPFRDCVRLHIDSGHSAQRLDAPAVIARAQAANLYCCGPGGYMDYIVATARAAGLADAAIHIEHFSSDVDKSGHGFDVVAQVSNKTVHVAEGETILEALEAAGIAVESACHTGVCGSCVTRVLSGTPDHRDMVLTEDERKRGDRIAVCCSRATSRQLVLEL